MPLTLTPLASIPLIRHGDDLADIFVEGLRAANIELADNDILTVTSKIVSKAEGRMVNLAAVTPGERALELGRQSEKDPRVVELMLRESNEVLRVRVGTIIVEHRLGFVCANAGIDHSNVGSPRSDDFNRPTPTTEVVTTWEGEDYVLLLPENPDQSASTLRAEIAKRTGKKIGVMVIDSHGRAWRNGTVGVCIGLSGIPALVDERGWKDLFGYTLRSTVVGVADELAAAASLVMGQAAEGTPAVHVRGFPYPLREGSLKELIRPKEQDLFR
jgi:coenzyme F420-0:L-glutamate ligase/coenzyme F420-1:gamma-L-glutamate ligase